MELRILPAIAAVCLFLFAIPAEAVFPITANFSSCNAYPGLVRAYGFNNYWRMREASGTSAAVADGTNTGIYENSPTLSQPGPLVSSSLAVTFDGSSQYMTSTNSTSPSNVVSVSVWFKTTTTSGGKLIGWGDKQTGLSANYDRHIYMINSGVLYWGIYNANGVNYIASTASYNDGNWHFALGTIGSDGMNFYIDGVSVGTNTSATNAQAYNGYWKVGGDTVTNWTGTPSSNYFAGTLAEPATSDSVEMTAAQVSTLYKIGKACHQ